MRRLALLLALAPLAVAGCKKDKEPEASAGPPPIQVTIAPAKRTGDTATLAVTVKNNSEAAFQVTGISIGYTDYPDCRVKESSDARVAVGGQTTLTVSVECAMKAYEGGQVKVDGTVMVSRADGSTKQRAFEKTVEIQ